MLPAGAATSVTVKPDHVYTPTGITVHKGDKVAITASGRAHFGGGVIVSLGPDGIPWGTACDRVSQARAGRNLPWPAPGVACWSLIARVGTSPPIGIGRDGMFTAENDGALELGVNDNVVQDNAGSWAAQVTVTPVGGGTSSSSGSSAVVIAAIVGGLILLGLLLFFLLRRRRKDADDEAPEPVPAAVAAAPVAAAAAASAPEPEPEPVPVTPDAPPDPESIDVNIFEVEFTNGLQLRVGYNHFPDGTLLNWKVTQSRKPVAAGSFVTQGGGSTNHSETVPLGVKLEGRDSEPDGADVQFDWNINGVPFRYSVRRDPNC
jgi:MYXO-CTERM domain-containing protein